MILHGEDGLIVRVTTHLKVAYTSSGGGYLLKKQALAKITNHFKRLHKMENTNYQDSLLQASHNRSIDL
jgi:hypothetical protein